MNSLLNPSISHASRRAAALELLRWLAPSDEVPRECDAIIGFGHFDLRIADRCADLFKLGHADRVIFTGGIGAGTADLGCPEADAFVAHVGRHAADLPPTKVIAENRSTTTVNNDTMRIVAANPDLRPQQVKNYDLSLEYYFEPAGYASVGLFRKDIRDFIYGSTGALIGGGPNNGFDGDYEGYQVTTDTNGGSARVQGIELAYNQRFTWLPGAWNGLSLSLNYTRLKSLGNYTATGSTQSGAELPGFMPETFNGSVSYAHRAWEAQIKYTYRAQNLRDYNTNPLLRVYYYSKKNVDLNLKYKWHPRLTLFADVINVFDDPIANAFVFVKQRVRLNQIFTPAIKAGLTGRF